MEITIQVVKILDVQSFTSKKDNQVYNRYYFVGKTTEGQYPKNICFTCMGDDNWKKFGIQVGGTYQVSFDISSREWNGRWYTDISVWRTQLISGAPKQERNVEPKVNAPLIEEQPQSQTNNNDAELPF